MPRDHQPGTCVHGHRHTVRKTVHAVLKRFYEPDPEHQEIPVENFVADILRDGEIIEIQTRGFNKLRRKLDTFLKYYPVTIVYPIIHTKWLYWINEETGELSPKRKSPKQEHFTMLFPNCIKLKCIWTIQICTCVWC